MVFILGALTLWLYASDDVKIKLVANDDSSNFAIQDSDGNAVFRVNSDGDTQLLNQAELRLYGSGSNYTGFKAQAATAADTIYALPLNDGNAGDVLKTNGSGVLSWVSKQDALGFTPEDSANKGAANGYCGLVSSLVPLANIPTTLTGKDADTLDTHHASDFSLTAHDHTGVYEAALGFTPEDSANKGAASGYASLGANSLVPTDELGTGVPTGSKFLRDDQTWAVPGGGSDPWTYVVLTSDFTTTSSSAVNVTGLYFTPGASTCYEVEGNFMLRTATATVGPRPGCTWPTGMTDGVVTFKAAASATTEVMASGNINAEVTCLNTGLATNTLSHPGYMFGMLVAGSSPSGNFQIRLTSETSGTQVTIKAGSYIRYRSY
jgi:hypothetical protein